MAIQQSAIKPVRGSALGDLGPLSLLAVTVLNEHTNDANLWPCERVVLAEHN
jgi:hypothetical protein